METQIVNEPRIMIAISMREAQAALQNPARLLSAIRSECEAVQADTQLSLPPPAVEAPKRIIRRRRRKMGGAKVSALKKPAKKEAAPSTPKPALKKIKGVLYCKVCKRPFITQGFLARHMKTVHAPAAADEPDEPVDDDDDDEIDDDIDGDDNEDSDDDDD